MNKRFRSILAAGIFTGGLIGSATLPAAAQGNYENQPQMNSAMQNLRQAEESLQAASPDKGGHRVRAIELIRRAEREVQSGIEYDNRYSSRGERYERRGGWQGRLSPDEQRQFDSYYSRWLDYRRTDNRDQSRSMEERMRDVMARNNIPGNVPFDQIASPRY